MSESISFAAQENLISKHWDQIDAFQESIRRSVGRPEYSFYDGPPFATGLPHYGHILAGTIKDVVTRYAHQTGHYVPRRFGWDCHGLPIEFEIEKDLGIKTRDEVLSLGIDKYNEHCESIVMRYSAQWEQTVKRLGRWIDFQNDYKTMDPTFMESVWHVFKQLYEKNLIYRGTKVTPYSTACGTPLSNFEANQNYKDTSDPAIVVSFPLDSDPKVSLVAWTTTPWTLPSNLALCVNASIVYVKIKDKKTGAKLVLAKARLTQLYSAKGEPAYEILSEFPGSELQGLTYVPLFPYFEARKQAGAFKVLTDNFVSEESGTGIVHLAPAFGEDDERVCRVAGIVSKDFNSMVCPIDANGRFTDDVPEYAKMHIKEADVLIMEQLKKSGRLIRKDSIVHSYPFCWRSDTPLIYRAIPSWFVAVESFKDRIVENNKQTYWVPKWVKEKRFHNWLVDARDWCISRNRFWGTPIPLWVSEDYEEIICVGSIEELYQLSGVRVENLHRQYVDHITIPSKLGKGVLRRVDEVLDCWFESGSMPYGQVHYPFENESRFIESFPADFIAEGIDQTRGWFYTLMVISTALFDKPAFKNLIVNGLVLAADGKKMSKRLKNYPDPTEVIDKYGADALRVYLINSPVVKGEDLRFQEEGVKSVVKDVLLPWFYLWQFFDQTARDLAQRQNAPFVLDDSKLEGVENVLDKWIIMEINQLVESVRKEMESYKLYAVIPRLLKFIQILTNFYVRLNRKRLKGTEGDSKSCEQAVSTLGSVLLTITVAMAPLTPFFSEWVYLKMAEFLPSREDSVHFLPYPTPMHFAWMDSAKSVTAMTSVLQSVIELGRTVRDQKKLPVKLPLKAATVIHYSELADAEAELLKQYAMTELNVKQVELTRDESSYIQFSAVLDFKKKGPELKGAAAAVGAAVKKLSHEEIQQAMRDKSLTLLGHTLSLDDLIIRRYSTKVDNLETIWNDQCTLILDTTVNDHQRSEWLMRQVVNHIQKIRKSLGLKSKEHINVYFAMNHTDVSNLIGQWQQQIARLVEVTLSAADHSLHTNGNVRMDCTKSLKYQDESIDIQFIVVN